MIMNEKFGIWEVLEGVAAERALCVRFSREVDIAMDEDDIEKWWENHYTNSWDEAYKIIDEAIVVGFRMDGEEYIKYLAD
jgi:cell division ATPase FtsA